MKMSSLPSKFVMLMPTMYGIQRDAASTAVRRSQKSSSVIVQISYARELGRINFNRLASAEYRGEYPRPFRRERQLSAHGGRSALASRRASVQAHDGCEGHDE